ncbi:MAG: hypothetical protein U5L02_04340 [Rheinheimera sp.]|nr:hypothetical protein [Rheinheimera sp.]
MNFIQSIGCACHFTLRALHITVFAVILASCSIMPVQQPMAFYDLSEIKDRETLGEFVSLVCAAGWPDISLVHMLTQPQSLISKGMEPCPVQHSTEAGNSMPYYYLSAQDTAWIFETHRIVQKGYFEHMGLWKRLNDPRDISFLHSAFATRPYLTARIMAAAQGPHIDNAWRLLATHMDRILLASAHDEDRRLLAYAMARDGREHRALDIIAGQLQKGDALALQVLSYVALDMPEPIDDEMAERSEPELGYRVLPMLESYLIQQNYPRSFCGWAKQLQQGPLKYYTDMLLTNVKESLACEQPDT